VTKTFTTGSLGCDSIAFEAIVNGSDKFILPFCATKIFRVWLITFEFIAVVLIELVCVTAEVALPVATPELELFPEEEPFDCEDDCPGFVVEAEPVAIRVLFPVTALDEALLLLIFELVKSGVGVGETKDGSIVGVGVGVAGEVKEGSGVGVGVGAEEVDGSGVGVGVSVGVVEVEGAGVGVGVSVGTTWAKETAG